MDMEATPQLDRFQGCLVGLALGDALGAPYEFEEAPKVDVSEFHRGFFGTAPGHPTDDTELAILLARALLTSHGVFDTEAKNAYLRSLVKWMRSNPPDIGGQTSKAAVYFESMGSSLPPDENACGNGSLMACAALGLAYAGAGRHAADKGAEFSALTHPSSRSQSAVGFLVQSISRLVVDPRPNPPCEPQVRLPECFAPTRDSIGLVTWCAALAYKVTERAETADDAFMELRLVIEQGGDTDTNAAVAGALLGARFGMAAWPTYLLDNLAKRDEMLELAGKLFEIAQARFSVV